MGGKPRAPRKRLSPKCVCGHKRSIHKEGLRCGYYHEYKNEDSTFVCETVCICHEFRSITNPKVINNEVFPTQDEANEQTT